MTLFSIPTESIQWGTFGTNLVISAQNCVKLSCGQGKVSCGRTDRRTDAGNDNPLRHERSKDKNVGSIYPDKTL